MYLPRANRSGVASNFSAVAGFDAGFRAANQGTPQAISATISNTTPPTIFRNVFMKAPLDLERFRSFYGTIRGMVFSVILLAATLQTNVASVMTIYDRDYAPRLVPLLSEVLQFPTAQFEVDGPVAQKA